MCYICCSACNNNLNSTHTSSIFPPPPHQNSSSCSLHLSKWPHCPHSWLRQTPDNPLQNLLPQIPHAHGLQLLSLLSSNKLLNFPSPSNFQCFRLALILTTSHIIPVPQASISSLLNSVYLHCCQGGHPEVGYVHTSLYTCISVELNDSSPQHHFPESFPSGLSPH